MSTAGCSGQRRSSDMRAAALIVVAAAVGALGLAVLLAVLALR